MKKIILTLNIILISLFINSNVYAKSYDVNITGSSEFTSEITLYLQVNNISDFTGACDGLCGLVGNLKYDTDKLTLTSITAQNGFDLTNGEKLVLYKNTGVGNGTKLLQLKFKNKGLSIGNSTNVTFTNVVASDGDSDIPSSNTSKTIKLIKTTTTTTTTTTTIEETKSNNNYLSSITLSYGQIDFNKEKTNYDIKVDSNVNSITITGTPEDTKSTVTGNDNYKINDKNTTIKLKVTAEDGTERTYTINITKENQVINNVVEEKDNKLIIIISIIGGILVLSLGAYFIFSNKKNN